MTNIKIAYECLTLNEKIAYEKFEKAFYAHESNVDMPAECSNVDIMKVLQAMLGDNPQVFYLNKTEVETIGGWFGNRKVHICGMYSLGEIRRMQLEVERQLRAAVEYIFSLNPITSYDKLMCIYKYIQETVKYDFKEYESTYRSGRNIVSNSHNIYGALINKTAVCDGIAALFCLLAQQMGFACTVVVGKSARDDLRMLSHAWNVVLVGKKYYHVDATWDMNIKDATTDYSYEYFCVSDEWIKKDHVWENHIIPICNSNELSFYVKKKCYVENMEQLDNVLEKCIKNNNLTIRVRLSDAVDLPIPVDKYIAQRFMDIGAKNGKYGTVNFSWNDRTRCFYASYET